MSEGQGDEPGKFIVEEGTHIGCLCLNQASLGISRIFDGSLQPPLSPWLLLQFTKPIPRPPATTLCTRRSEYAPLKSRSLPVPCLDQATPRLPSWPPRKTWPRCLIRTHASQAWHHGWVPAAAAMPALTQCVVVYFIPLTTALDTRLPATRTTSPRLNIAHQILQPHMLALMKYRISSSSGWNVGG